jgi:hypothetical protein
MNGSPPAACPCEIPQDPQVVSNRPGLASITDRVDDFTGFRRALLRPLPGEQALGLWQPAPGDLGLQFLEWWAYIADVLTFYNERIANEAYLPTAQFSESIAGLVALLGYIPAPGLAATGQVGAIRTTTYPAEPLVIPDGMQLASTATPGVAVQTFEAAGANFPGLSDVVATLAPNTNLDATDAGPVSVLLAGKVTGAKPSDRLLLVVNGWPHNDGANDTTWSAVTVDTVSPETDPSTGAVNTRVSFTSTAQWGTTTPLQQSSASQATRTATDYRLMKPTAAASLWSLNHTVLNPTAPVAGRASSQTVNLSATVRSIQPGDLVLCDGGDPAVTTLASALGLVTATSDQLGNMPFPPPQPSPPAPDLVIPYTALTVTTPDSDTLSGYNNNPGAIAVRHGFRDVGTVLPNPVATLTALPATAVLPVVPAGFTLPAGVSTALLEDTTGAGTVVQAAPTQNPDPTSDAVALALSPAPSAAANFDPPLQVPLRLLFDVVKVSRGTTVNNEVLGSGNAALANQSFTLQKSPLTYLASGAGWTTTLAVYVDNIKWNEVRTLYNQPPGAQVYVVQRSPDQSVTTVRFGDGINGSRLTSGTGNVVATYRYGSGAASPPAGRLTTIVQRQPNLAAIHNPVAVAGGKDPQDPADVKTNAPASVLTFGRAISALDYEVVAGQAAGVTRVKAYWTFDATAQRTLVKIYVNDDPGVVAAATQALAGSDDPNRPVTVAAAQAIEVWVSATLVVAANQVVDNVKAAAATALTDPATGAFSPAQMRIGQWLYRSRIAAALSVPGVVAVHQLQVTWAAATLDQVADPGEGAYFQLPAANLTLTGVPANG